MTSAVCRLITVLSPQRGKSRVFVLPLSRRCLSSYEFPMRTEAPVVTRTLASDEYSLDKGIINNDANNHSSLNNTSLQKEKEMHRWLGSIMGKPSGKEEGPFNDETRDLSLSPSQRRTIRSPRNTSRKRFSPPSPYLKISSIVPNFVPPNLPREVLIEPMTHVTTLSNGVRVASQETYGQVCTLGLLSNCGSRLESSKEGTTGVNHLMEIMAFHGTPGLSFADFMAKMDNLGGGTFASASREHFLYCVDVLRPNASEALRLLGEAVLNPRFDEADVEESKRVVEWQLMDIIPEVKLVEGLQIAGFGPVEKGGNGEKQQQQLGMPHFCPLEALPNISSQTIKNFRDEHLLNPKNMVIAGAGIAHDELVFLAEEVFGHITANNIKISSTGDSPDSKTSSTALTGIVPSVYTGGEYRLSTPSVDGFTRVALAFPTGGWFSSDLVPACVLQTLLGGGSSFSAGGPGKGMYSRLYREVLNRYYWVECAEAFTSMHSEVGLIGITGSSIPSKSRDLTRVLAEHFMRLMSEDVGGDELDRAKNMLKCNVLTQLESRLVLFEDLGRQILTYGKREQTEEMVQKIEDITKEDIGNIARKAVLGSGQFNDSNGCQMQRNAPTLSIVGGDVDGVPRQEEVADWFRAS